MTAALERAEKQTCKTCCQLHLREGRSGPALLSVWTALWYHGPRRVRVHLKTTHEQVLQINFELTHLLVYLLILDTSFPPLNHHVYSLMEKDQEIDDLTQPLIYK